MQHNRKRTAASLMAIAGLLASFPAATLIPIAAAETPRPGFVVSAQPAEKPLEKAKALTRLGELAADGDFASPDYASAVSYFRQAADLGDRRARLRLAELMVFGRGTQQNIPGGLAMIHDMADGGDGNALFLLGELSAKGTAGAGQGTAAVDAYKRAAEAGRTIAFVRLGQIYFDGKLVPRNLRKSVDFYLAATAAGRDAALVPLGKLLAEGKLAFYGSPADGVEFLRKADQLGVPEAAAALADCYLKGHGVRQSRSRAVELLQNSLSAGNVQAGRRLVALYRDGHKKLIRRDPAAAENYFARIKYRLSPRVQKAEALLLRAATTDNKTGYADIENKLFGMHPQDRPSAVRKLLTVNPNAYVFVVQSRLRNLGLFRGKATGTLSASTVRAISKFCRGREQRNECKAGPMSPPVAEIVTAAF